MAKRKPTKPPKVSTPPRGRAKRSFAKSAKSPPPAAAVAASTDPPTSRSSIVTKGDWVKWSGRAYKILDEQAQRYGIPVGEATIDLAQVAVWIHDLLAAHGRRILAGDSASEIWDDIEHPEREEGGPASPALERKREVEYQLRLRDLAERDQQLVSREKTRQGLAVAAGIFKAFGDTLQRQFGADAIDLWNDALNDWERAIESFFGQGTE